MEHIVGKAIELDKDKNQELVKYNRGEVRAQRILIKSIKNLTPFVADLGTSKDIYDKLVKLYAVSTKGQKIS